MEWLRRMTDALEYLEEHMDDDVDMAQAASVACSSSFHFQRMFHIVMGVTVAEYVRNRRLSLAAQELSSSRIRVIDASLKYGYDSPEAFTKAFRRLHGISPSEAKLPGARLKFVPRLSFHISLKGDKDMDYRIVEKPAFSTVGTQMTVSTDGNEDKKKIPQFWDRTIQDGSFQQLTALSAATGPITGAMCLGLCADFAPDMKQFNYVIAVETAADAPVGFVRREIPATTWAVFESVGAMPDAIQQLFGRIFSEFFPATGYEHAPGPEVEVYLPGDVASADYRFEVWIPVKKA